MLLVLLLLIGDAAADENEEEEETGGRDTSLSGEKITVAVQFTMCQGYGSSLPALMYRRMEEQAEAEIRRAVVPPKPKKRPPATIYTIPGLFSPRT